jgi:hypothetical protein
VQTESLNMPKNRRRREKKEKTNGDELELKGSDHECERAGQLSRITSKRERERERERSCELIVSQNKKRLDFETKEEGEK